MDALETVKGLTTIAARAPGTDAERRAARWLAKRLRDAGHDVETEAVWVRPQWAFVHALQRLVSGCPRLADLTLEECPTAGRQRLPPELRHGQTELP